MSQPNDKTISVEEQSDRVVVRLNRPEARIAINHAMVAELHEVCARLEDNPRVLLLAGNNRMFAAGADIRELRKRRATDALRGINSGLFDRIAALPMPSIALIDGPAIGGGAELAYACDFRVGTNRARFGNPEPGLGILAAAGGTWRLRDLVGEPVAKEVLLAGRTLDAAEAHALRLLNEVVEAEDLEATGHRWTDRICTQSALAVQLTKTAFRVPTAAHPAIDNLAQAILFETEEKTTRMTNFLDRKAGSR